jgi:uncharacterized protein with ParB-like and HNH nuclease domain
VDGQQRLTTITILLCVLRDKLAENACRDLAEGIHGLVERKNIDNKPEFIVSTESSYPFFQDQIQKWGPPAIKIEPLAEELSLQHAHLKFQLLVNEVTVAVQIDPTVSDNKRDELIRQRIVSIRY